MRELVAMKDNEKFDTRLLIGNEYDDDGKKLLSRCTFANSKQITLQKKNTLGSKDLYINKYTDTRALEKWVLCCLRSAK